MAQGGHPSRKTTVNIEKPTLALDQKTRGKIYLITSFFTHSATIYYASRPIYRYIR